MAHKPAALGALSQEPHSPGLGSGFSSFLSSSGIELFLQRAQAHLSYEHGTKAYKCSFGFKPFLSDEIMAEIEMDIGLNNCVHIFM